MHKLSILMLSLFTAASLHAQNMVITRAGSRPAQQGPAANFTGTVRVTPLFDATGTTRASGASVSFDAGARSAWHTHPRGQTLVVTSGVGRVQQWGGAVEEIRPGDVVWTPPGVKHWHGAAPGSGMTHIAIQEHEGGKVVEWMEKVTDAQYQSTTRSDAMSDAPSDARKAFGDIAPALATYTDEVLFGDVWKRAGLSPRDRSLITVAALHRHEPPPVAPAARPRVRRDGHRHRARRRERGAHQGPDPRRRRRLGARVRRHAGVDDAGHPRHASGRPRRRSARRAARRRGACTCTAARPSRGAISPRRLWSAAACRRCAKAAASRRTPEPTADRDGKVFDLTLLRP